VMPFDVLNKEKKILLEAGYNNCDKLIEDYNQGKLSLKAGCDAG
jgi:hypothetical protein